MLRKKYCRRRRIGQGGEADRALVREEQGHREAAVGVGEANEHVARSGPNVKGLALDQGAAVGPGGDDQFLVPVLNYLLVPIHRAQVLQGRTVQLSDGTSGMAHGVGEDGALLVHTAGGMLPITSSEISVRPAPADGPSA